MQPALMVVGSIHASQRRKMNILQAIKCKIGSHQWSEWRYITKYRDSLGKSCEMERMCNFCQVHETRQEQPHSWQGWTYIADSSCDQEQLCNHCQAKDYRQAIHDWGEWEYHIENSCDQKRVCVRCRQEETRTAIHEWGNWEDETDDEDRQVGNRVSERQCTRCGFTRAKEYGKKVQKDFDDLAAAYSNQINGL
jgi:hypothetical protein